VAKSAKHRASSGKEGGGVDFNECEAVDDRCDLLYPGTGSGKGSGDQSSTSCRSSPSPEQVPPSKMKTCAPPCLLVRH
jgi:hypothetical protein